MFKYLKKINYYYTVGKLVLSILDKGSFIAIDAGYAYEYTAWTMKQRASAPSVVETLEKLEEKYK